MWHWINLNGKNVGVLIDLHLVWSGMEWSGLYKADVGCMQIEIRQTHECNQLKCVKQCFIQDTQDGFGWRAIVGK